MSSNSYPLGAAMQVNYFKGVGEYKTKGKTIKFLQVTQCCRRRPFQKTFIMDANDFDESPNKYVFSYDGTNSYFWVHFCWFLRL